MVNRKEKEMLQEGWSKSKAITSEVPDGTYQFEIVEANYVVSQQGRPNFKLIYKITGGNEDFIGKTVTDNNNLETAENMGWFKRKLIKLNIMVPEEFEEIMDGTLAEELVGKHFEGQVKTKNDFLNVYINRLTGESTTKEDDDDDMENYNKNHENTDLEVGDNVEWNGKTGKIIEILEDDKARVEKEDGKVTRVKLEKLTKIEEEEDDQEQEEEEEEDDGEKEKKEDSEPDEIQIPEPSEIENMNAREVAKNLKDLGYDAKKIPNARGVLRAYCDIAHNGKDAVLNASEIKPLSTLLGLKLKVNTPIKKVKAAIVKEISDLLGK